MKGYVEMNQSLEPEVFNIDDLLRRMMGDKELAVEILSEFLADLFSQIDELRKSISNGETDIIERQIHTIKGASGNVGAKRLEKLARDAEKAGIAADPVQASAFVSDLLRQADLLKIELKNNGFL
jgi:HPt (histidine-containing phosphotransfer) domain-containing protein